MAEEKSEELTAILAVLEKLNIPLNLDWFPENPLVLVRGVINSMNSSILSLAEERSKYRKNSVNYEEMNPLHNKRHEELLGKRDLIFVCSRYLPCLAEICESGDDSPGDFEKCLEIDRKFMPILGQRIDIGKAVAVHKSLWELDTYHPEREKQVLDNVVAMSEERGYELAPGQVRGLFRQIMEMNKAVQRCHRSGIRNNEGHEIASRIRVGPEDMIPNARIWAMRYAKRKDPEAEYAIRVSVDKDGMYVVEAKKI